MNQYTFLFSVTKLLYNISKIKKIEKLNKRPNKHQTNNIVFLLIVKITNIIIKLL